MTLRIAAAFVAGIVLLGASVTYGQQSYYYTDAPATGDASIAAANFLAQDESSPSDQAVEAPCSCQGGCTGNCNSGCGCVACTTSRSFASVDYFLGWGRARRAPALVTTSNAGDAGVLGAASTTTLFGGGNIGDTVDSGGRIDLGYWLDDSRSVAIGARVFGFDSDSTSNTFNSGGTPLLAMPFFNAQTSLNDAFVVATPTSASGNIGINHNTDVFTTELYLRMPAWQSCGVKLDLLAGYHFARIDDAMSISTFSTDLDGTFLGAVGNTRNTADLFDAENEFHGATLGMIGEIVGDRVTLAMMGKVSYGNMNQRVSISGATTNVTAGPTTATFPGGIYSMPSNIGNFSQDEDVWVPEATVTLRYEVNSCLSLTMGYSFVYWSNIVTAADQIDTTVNLSQANGGALAGPARPQFVFRDTDFWVQGINFGATWNY